MIYRKHNGTLEPLVPQPQTPTKLPVNYVYVQLAGTEFPSVLYPNNTWTEITFSQSYFHRARSTASVGDTQSYTTAKNGESISLSGLSSSSTFSHAHYDSSCWGGYHSTSIYTCFDTYGLCACHGYYETGGATYQYVTNAYCAGSGGAGSAAAGYYNASLTWCSGGSTSFNFPRNFSASETRPQNIAYRLWRVTA